MLVDPQILRNLAAQVETASASIRSADVGHKVETAADQLPRSTTQWAAHAVGEHFSQMAGKLAKNVSRMGEAVRGAGSRFEVTDDALAGGFDGLF
jgi:uncharacterized protein YukE